MRVRRLHRLRRNDPLRRRRLRALGAPERAVGGAFVADRHVAQGKCHLAQQQHILKRLVEINASDQMLGLARELLDQFEWTLQFHCVHRDEIEKSLRLQSEVPAVPRAR